MASVPSTEHDEPALDPPRGGGPLGAGPPSPFFMRTPAALGDPRTSPALSPQGTGCPPPSPAWPDPPFSPGRQNTHQPQKPKEEPAKTPAVAAAVAPLTPKQEPAEEEPPPSVSKISESSSSSSEDEDPPSSPEVRKSKRGRFQRKPEPGRRTRSNGWTCGICHSWFPERDEYVVHMKKIHGKVRGRSGFPLLFTWCSESVSLFLSFSLSCWVVVRVTRRKRGQYIGPGLPENRNGSKIGMGGFWNPCCRGRACFPGLA